MLSTLQRVSRLADAGFFMVLLVLGCAAASAETIVNRWTQLPIAIQNGTPAAQQGVTGANWVLEDAGGGFVRLKDSATSGYLNVETGALAVGPIQPGWWSAQWTLEPADAGFVRIKNRWTGVYLNVEKGPLAATAIEPGWWSAQWQVSAAQDAATATQGRKFPETYKSPGALPQGAIDALSSTERACFDSVQGKVAWNRAGSTDWGAGRNIVDLCEGTQYPAIRLKCFQSEVQRHDDMRLAIMACKNAEASLRPARSTADATKLLPCAERRQQDEQVDFMTALAECDAYYTAAADDPSKAEVGVLPALGNLEQACFGQVQGKIARDQSGNTQWPESSLRTLCDGTPNPEWTTSCLRQELAKNADSRRAVSACKASTQKALGIVIPPRDLKSPTGVDAGQLCSEVFKCALDTAQGQLPVSVCSSCGSGALSVAASIQRLVESPSFGNGCAAANEVKWLKDTITGGFNSAVGLTVCAIAPATGNLDAHCNSACVANECFLYGLNGDTAQYKACRLRCACDWNTPICEQGTKAIADSACKALGLLK